MGISLYERAGGRLFKWLSGPIFTVLAALPLVSALRPAAMPHPLYISVTEISHNSKDKILEVSCKVFTNDFEAVLEKIAGAKVDLSSVKDKAASDKLIAGYVERHLRLKVDGKPVQLHFVGSENEEDGTWSYFQVNDMPTVKRIDAITYDLDEHDFPHRQRRCGRNNNTFWEQVA